MATKLNKSARLKLVVMSIFVCLMAVALWKSDTLGRRDWMMDEGGVQPFAYGCV